MSTPLDVDVGVLKERVNALSELRTDVKDVLTTVQRIEVRLASTPSYSDLEPLKSDIEELKLAKASRAGGKKMLLTLVTASSTVGGYVSTHLPNFWVWLTATHHSTP